MTFILPKHYQPGFREPHKKPDTHGKIDKTIYPLYYWDLNHPSFIRDIARGPGISNAMVDGVAPTFIEDRVGQGLSFNGSSQRLKTGTITHNIGSGPFSIIAHIRTGSSFNSYAGLLVQGNFDPGFIYARLNGAAWGSYIASDQTANTTLAVNTEYVLGISYINNYLYFYLNGVPDGSRNKIVNSGTSGFLRMGSSSETAGNHFSGRIYSVAFDNRAYSSAEHQYIAENRGTWAVEPSNPYSYPFAEISGGGPSQVSSDLTLHWSIVNAIQKSTDLQWGVLNTIGNNADLRWGVLQAIGKSSDLQWSTLISAAKDVDARWNILNTVLKDSDLRYRILNAAGNEVDLQWSVDSSIQKVSKSMNLQWSILAAVAKSLDSQWSTLNIVGSDLDARWAIVKAVSKDTDLQWAILNSITASASVDIRWSVIETTSKTITLQWRIESDSEFPDVLGVITLNTATPKITLH